MTELEPRPDSDNFSEGDIVLATYVWGSENIVETRPAVVRFDENEGAFMLDMGGGGSIWFSTATNVTLVPEEEREEALKAIEAHGNDPDAWHNKFARYIERILEKGFVDDQS